MWPESVVRLGRNTHPLGCAAGLASLALLKNDKTQKQIEGIEAIHHRLLNELSKNLLIERHRYCGTIAAFDLKIPLAYGDSISVNMRQFFQEKGLLVRPLGNTIYFMPPYCMTELELENAYQIVIDEIQRVRE